MGMKTDSGHSRTATSNELVTYLKGVRSEWGKVTWPERQQVVVETVFVVVIVFVFTLFIFGVDKLIDFILSLLKVS